MDPAIPRLMQVELHADRHALAEALADWVADGLRESLRDAAGPVTLVVSGGTTPEAMLRALAARPLAWERVQVCLADERQVPADSPRRNERLLRDALFQGQAAAARLVSLWPEAGLDAAQRAWETLRWPAAVTVLGMGEDGHTASLFPDADGLEAALDPAAAPGLVTIPAPGAPEPRVSMNLAALVRTERLALHIEGAAKRDALSRALTQDLPIARVLRRFDGRPRLYTT